MENLSYGIATPKELLLKLRSDAEKLNSSPHPYDVFNFIITICQTTLLSRSVPQKMQKANGHCHKLQITG